MNEQKSNHPGWTTAVNPYPRLKIITADGEQFLLPWHLISLVKADSSLKMLELHTGLGLLFQISSAEPLTELLLGLQTESVNVIQNVEGLRVQLVVPEITCS